jgi:regulator of CtrA degradation
MGQNLSAIAALFNLRGNYIAMLTISLSGQRQRERAMLTQSFTGRVSAPREVRRRVMSEKSLSETQPVSFRERLASSQAFADLFRDGMALVEETATYLDGPGRQQSKKLERAAALAYATESMRLTTRLMQLASWLLLHRAVKEGEMSLAQAGKEKSKVKLATADSHDASNIELVPVPLRELIERSQKLYAKVRRLDASIYNQGAAARPATGNPVERQLGLLKAAFGAESA